MSLRNIAKRSLSFFDIEIIRLRKNKTIHFSSPHPYVHFGIDLVFDIGANMGQFAVGLRHSGFKGKIISFEPLPEAHKIVSLNSKNDPLWVVHERVALGSKNTSSTVNIAGNSMSSSLLQMLPSHIKAAPESEYISQAAVDVITFDSVFEKYINGYKRPAVKIDTQGFEFDVLVGAENSLGKIPCFHIELSTIPLYENEKTYEWFFKFFEEHGFVLWDIKPGFIERESGRLLQFDACFVNSDLLHLTP
jgi:FkbM family methyltransferase